MDERIPVLTIHGVNNRDEERFLTDAVQPLQVALDQRGGSWKLWPIYWGDLGAGDEYLDRTLGDVARASEGDVLFPPDDERNPPDRFLVCLASTAGVTDAEQVEAVRRAWPELVAIPYLSEEMCATAALAYADASARDNATRAAELEVRAVILGVHRAIAEFLRKIRLWAMPNIFRFAGDIAVYLSHAGKRLDPNPPPPGKLIQDRVTLKLKELRDHHGDDWGTAKRPIPAAAHSLGALVLFDFANRPDVDFAIDTMVSFGTQVSAIHLMEPRPRCPSSTEAKGSRSDATTSRTGSTCGIRSTGWRSS